MIRNMQKSVSTAEKELKELKKAVNNSFF